MLNKLEDWLSRHKMIFYILQSFFIAVGVISIVAKNFKPEEVKVIYTPKFDKPVLPDSSKVVGTKSLWPEFDLVHTDTAWSKSEGIHSELPGEIDVWFECANLNGRKEPWTGTVLVDGKKFCCDSLWQGTTVGHIGTIGAGETKTLEIK